MAAPQFNPSTTGNPFWGTKLLGFSVGRSSGALKGSRELPMFPVMMSVKECGLSASSVSRAPRRLFFYPTSIDPGPA